MGVLEDKLLEAMKIIAESKDKELPFDYTVRGKVVEINSNTCIVDINGEEYKTYVLDGINININDIVLIKKINNNDSEKIIIGKLGIVRNEIPVFTNNEEAVSGGLKVGMFYRTGANPDVVCVVH